MKTGLRIAAVLLIVRSLVAAGEPPNVISYYAVNNTLDGQPMIDMVNVLRFYPVYAMRSSIDRVKITIYYGGNIYARDASSYEDGLYWQSLLPSLRLGQAIQRIEVEVRFRLDPHFSVQLARLDSLSAQTTAGFSLNWT